MPKIFLREIDEAVCAAFKLNQSQLHARRRNRAYCWPRFAAFYLARTHTTRSLPQIAKHFGGLDHTTVLAGARRVSELVGEYPGYARRLKEAEKELERIASGRVAAVIAASWC